LQDYQKRLGHYIPFSLTVIPELKNTKSLTSEQQKQAEGELILRNMTASTDMILLDERGKEFRSVEFADYVQKKMSSGRDLVFVVGGPYGFSEAVYQRANGQISLSQMTFSHQMVRLFFVEQIYRAMTILRGEPYHHE
jgi:23S rRNA (pseudouridine1915-N3)-methyltransferase